MKSIDKKQRRALRVYVWIFVVLLAIGATTYDMLIIYPSAKGAGDGDEVEVVIGRGDGPEAIARKLQAAGVINAPGRFKLWMKLNDQMPGIKAGRFILNDAMSPRKAVAVLKGRGQSNGVRITVPEGYKLSQIGMLLAKRRLVSQEDFRRLVFDKAFLTSLEIPGPSAEGFLFPDTYFFEQDTTAEVVIKKMHQQFKKKTAELNLPSGNALLRIVSLASIVQAEAKVTAEAPLIAGVYQNRLNKEKFPSGLLQADPTVAYGCDRYRPIRPISCKGFTGRLTHRQLFDATNKYNTYKRAGLPPGPIAAPGLNAIAAAAEPQHVPFLYFVVSSGGRHKFSTDYAEHLKAVQAYRNRD